MKDLRGYFGIGIERGSKPRNLGNLFRTAQAFGADFTFTIEAQYPRDGGPADTGRSLAEVPYYAYESLDDFQIPAGASLVGVEITDEAQELPSFPHPRRALYVLGPEKGHLSEELQARCQHMVKIPTRFSLNVATAGAILLYDRHRMLGRYNERPISETGEAKPPTSHIQGEVRRRKHDKNIKS